MWTSPSARRPTLVDDRHGLRQQFEGFLAIAVIEGKRSLKPVCDLCIEAAFVARGDHFQPLAQRRRDADVNGQAVFCRRHDCDLWTKGLQPEIGALCATNVPLGATIYPQASKLIITP